MPSRKKAFVLLRGVLRGQLIVGTRAWYEINEVAKDRRWKLMHQSNDEALLLKMAALGNPVPESPLDNPIDKWYER
jgi:hypothetical protein